jgi:hypothetical protein
VFKYEISNWIRRVYRNSPSFLLCISSILQQGFKEGIHWPWHNSLWNDMRCGNLRTYKGSSWWCSELMDMFAWMFPTFFMWSSPTALGHVPNFECRLQEKVMYKLEVSLFEMGPHRSYRGKGVLQNYVPYVFVVTFNLIESPYINLGFLMIIL